MYNGLSYCVCACVCVCVCESVYVCVHVCACVCACDCEQLLAMYVCVDVDLRDSHSCSQVIKITVTPWRCDCELMTIGCA